MDDALVHLSRIFPEMIGENGLNPCFNGWCTRTDGSETTVKNVNVLILVLMDDALVHWH